MKVHYLYRAIGEADELLYVGVTSNITRRMYKHRAESPWHPLVTRIELVEYPSFLAAHAVEIAEIQSRSPRYNVRHRDPAAKAVPPIEGEYISTSQAARMLQVNVSTVNRMAQDGRLPQLIKVGGLRGARMFRLVDVQALLTSEVAS